MVSFNGIFSKIYSYCKNDLTLIKQHINVEATVLSGRGSPWTVIDPNFENSILDTNWISDNSLNQKFTVSFLNHKIILHSYSVKSRFDYDNHHPLEWNLEGSNDGLIWNFIHHKKRGYELNGKGISLNFPCKQKQAYKAFRLKMIGTDTEGHNYFSLGKFELFGDLMIKDKTNKDPYQNVKTISLILKISQLILCTLS